MTLRTSAKHWRHLAILLAAFERTVEACERLDVYRQTHPYGGRRGTTSAEARRHAARLFAQRQRLLTDRLDREVNRVTAELLIAETTRKRQQAAG